MKIDKKEEEKHILEHFIDAYKEQIDNNSTFRILENEEVKLKYPGYHGENPDFIVQFNEEYIGIELFKLVGDRLSSLNKDLTGINAKNIVHLNAIIEREERVDFIETEDLVKVAIECILKKLEKIKNYINCMIWLIGYTPFPHGKMVSAHFDDKRKDEVASIISSAIPNDGRVAKIWLAEFTSRSYLLKIK